MDDFDRVFISLVGLFLLVLLIITFYLYWAGKVFDFIGTSAICL